MNFSFDWFAKKRLRGEANAGLLLVFVVPRLSFAAISIDAALLDLPDTTPGEDLWDASFTLSGGTFLANQGFTIFFPSGAYRSLSAPLAPIPGGWDALTAQPDVLLSAPGFLDGLALSNSPDLSQPFNVNFTWLAPGQPGSQNFQIYDQSGTFQIIGSGQTAVVPEPSCGALLLAGLGVFAGRRQRRCQGESQASPELSQS